VTAPLRVMVVHNRYRTEQPSGEDRVVDQETALLRDAGVEVERFLRHSDDIARMSLPAKAAVPLRVPWNPKARAALTEALRAHRPDVVHIHSTFPLLSPSVLAACADVGVPAVATLHNYTQVCAPGTFYRAGRICTDCAGGSPLPAVRNGCYRGSPLATLPVAVGLAANRARWWTGVARFLCISDSQRNLLVQSGMPAERMVVHHNIVPDPGVRRTGSGEHVLYLGRMTEEKGLRTLMAGWERLAQRDATTLPLVLAGSGPMAGEVGAWAEARADARYVGLQSRAECAALLGAAAAVVVPSVWLETFGLVVVEAMAAGVPVIASAHGAFVELVDDGVTGLLYRPADAESLAERLSDALRHPQRNRAMGAAARARYERDFVAAAGVERLIREYRAVMAHSVCPPL
jgi:glycosyltransferase involved in cell wall biosynthesis